MFSILCHERVVEYQPKCGKLPGTAKLNLQLCRVETVEDAYCSLLYSLRNFMDWRRKLTGKRVICPRDEIRSSHKCVHPELGIRDTVFSSCELRRVCRKGVRPSKSPVALPGIPGKPKAAEQFHLSVCAHSTEPAEPVLGRGVACRKRSCLNMLGHIGEFQDRCAGVRPAEDAK